MMKRTLPTPLLVWGALALNVLVILQGAVVRATGAGAGCGRHWPTCNGEVIPLAHGSEALIEFSHRLLSLSVLLLGVWLVRRAWRLRREKPGFLVWAAASFGFLIIEALLGAATVLLGLTGDTATLGRGLMVATHLVNSLLLIGSLAVTLVFSRDESPAWPLRPFRQGTLTTVLAVGLVGMLFLMFSGGVAAMGNTIFPSESLRAGIAADFDPASHPLIRLRILHPLIAISVGIYLFASLGIARWLKPVPQAKRLSQFLFGVYLLQLLIGTTNLALLAPALLQIVHLGVAVLAFALLAAVTVSSLGYPASSPRPVARPAAPAAVEETG